MGRQQWRQHHQRTRAGTMTPAPAPATTPTSTRTPRMRRTATVHPNHDRRPSTRPKPASNCSQSGSRVLAADNNVGEHQDTRTTQHLTKMSTTAPGRPPQHTTHPQPHKQLLVGWITGGTTRRGHSQRGTKTRNDGGTRGGMAEDNKDENKEAQQQHHQQHQQPMTQHPDPG
jgi:hypothetical protein